MPGWVEGALESSEEVLKRINDIKTCENNKFYFKKGGGKRKQKIKKYTRKAEKHNKPQTICGLL